MQRNTRVISVVKMVAGGIALAAVCVLAFTVVEGQQPANQTPRLSLEDKEEIRELMYRYMYYLDNCTDRNKGYDYADLFTPDGRFGLPPGGRQGREPLAAFPGGKTPEGGCTADRVRGPANQIHINIGHVIEPSPEGARSTSYLMMVDGPGGQPYWDGWYEDIIVRTPNGWRFKQRVHVAGQRAGIPPAAGEYRRQVRAAATTMAPSTQPVSRDPVKWVDGVDNRPLEQTRTPGPAAPTAPAAPASGAR